MKPMDEEQKRAFHLIEEGKNVFITGKAGTGKTFFLKYIIDELRKRYDTCVHVCAPTGIAAINIAGRTIHNMFNVNVTLPNPDKHLKDLTKRGLIDTFIVDPDKRNILIIDEISQCSSLLFNFINEFLSKVNGVAPFGGWQIIVVGDFYQLGPIYPSHLQTMKDFPIYVFETEAWEQAQFHCVMFRKIYRQKNEEFISLLNEVREGNLSLYSKFQLEKRIYGKNSKEEDEIKTSIPTFIMGRKKDVNEINDAYFKRLDGIVYSYKKRIIFYYEDPRYKTRIKYEDRKDHPYIDWPSEQIIDDITRRIKNDLGADDLYLKKNALVMLTANIDVEEGFCNGLRGTVLDFTTDGDPLVEFENGKTTIVYPTSFKSTYEETHLKNYPNIHIYAPFLPLVLAYAITIHKCQGMTIKNVVCKLDKRNIFTHHMGYCLLSRVTDLKGLYVIGDIDYNVFTVDKKIKEFYDEISH